MGLNLFPVWSRSGLASCPSLDYNVESTTSYTFPVQTGGIFYFPWHIHQIEGTKAFSVSKKTLAKRGKLNCQGSEAK